MAEQELLALVKRLEAVAAKLEGSAPGSDTSGKCKNLLQAYVLDRVSQKYQRFDFSLFLLKI